MIFFRYLSSCPWGTPFNRSIVRQHALKNRLRHHLSIGRSRNPGHIARAAEKPAFDQHSRIPIIFQDNEPRSLDSSIRNSQPGD
jgi:hypothetical protein